MHLHIHLKPTSDPQPDINPRENILKQRLRQRVCKGGFPQMHGLRKVHGDFGCLYVWINNLYIYIYMIPARGPQTKFSCD